MNKKLLMNAPIAIIGGGYVGLPLAISFASDAMRSVTVFDIDNSKVDDLSNGIDDTDTPDFKEYFSKIRFTSRPKDLEKINIFIVTVPTPINEKFEPDLSYITNAIEIIAPFFKKNSLIIFESTVYPGATEEVFIPLLENKTGLDCKTDFWAGYSPERINPGDHKNTLKQIVKLVSGSCHESGEFIKGLYSEIVDEVFLTSSIKVAESSKVIENVQRDINIALMNELSIIFKNLDINMTDVLEAAKTKWNFLDFTPGLVGGHCIGIDPYYLMWKSTKAGYFPSFLTEARKINESMAEFHAGEILKLLSKNSSNKKIIILGVTFKENCSDIRNSKVIDLIAALKEYNFEVSAVDPYVKQEDFNIVELIDINEIEFQQYALIVLATPHRIFSDHYTNFKDIPIYDIKGIFPK